MPHWMKHSDHGIMPVYDLGEVERNKKFGWVFLNTGEDADRTVKPVMPAPAAPDLSVPKDEHEAAPTDILDLPVVQILPQFKGMSRQDLEALRAREVQGKTRKGLLAAMDDALKG